MVTLDPVTSRPLLLLNVHDHEQQWLPRTLHSVMSKGGWEVLQASTAEAALERLRAASPDALFIHASLPDMEGTELCRHLRVRQLVRPSVPILLTSCGAFTHQSRLEAYRSGAWDCLHIPFPVQEVLTRLSNYVGGKLEADEAHERSLVDPATDAYSRKGLLRWLGELGDLAKRYHRPLGGAAFALLTSGPPPSETAGESAALDAAMRNVAQMLHAKVRSSDVIGRLSRTEFVLLAPETPLSGVVRLAERIVRQAAEQGMGLNAGCHAFADPYAVMREPGELISGAISALRLAETSGGPGRVQVHAVSR